MSIEIKFTKLIETGQPKVQIDKIKALPIDRLPKEYFRKGYYCYQGVVERFTENNKRTIFKGNCLRIYNGKDLAPIKELREGDIMEAIHFYEALYLVRKCGKRLMKINKKLRKETQGWKDGETEKIKI